MKACFKVVGEILTKQRPRATMVGGHPTIYTPKDTLDYENYIRSEFQRQCGNIHFGKEFLRITIEANFKPSQEVAKREHYYLCGCVKHKDNDNIEKIVFDALQPLCMDDDKQIVENHTVKKYSNEPYEYLCITIETLDDLLDINDLKALEKVKGIDRKIDRLFKKHNVAYLSDEPMEYAISILSKKEFEEYKSYQNTKREIIEEHGKITRYINL